MTKEEAREKINKQVEKLVRDYLPAPLYKICLSCGRQNCPYNKDCIGCGKDFKIRLGKNN